MGYEIQFQHWRLQTRMTLTSMFGIQSQNWFSILMLVLNHKFDIGSEFSRSISIGTTFYSWNQAWYTCWFWNHKLGIQ